MQVVLLGDVKALGKEGQIMNVNNSYTGSSILPKKFGIKASSKNLSDLELKRADDDRIATEQLAAAEELGAKLDDSSVVLAIKAGEGRKAFGSMSSKEIAKAIGDQLGVDIDKKKIMLSDLIESIGSLEMPVKLHKDVTTRLAIKVMEA